jgi:hypothetical protein
VVSAWPVIAVSTVIMMTMPARASMAGMARRKVRVMCCGRL